MNRALVTSNLRARLQIGTWRHGWVWGLTVVVAAITLVLQFAVLKPGSAALESARQDWSRERRLSTLPNSSTARPVAFEQQQSELQAMLRQSPPADELMRKMLSLAQAEQIGLTQSDYQYQFDSTTQVMQVQVAQPVKAPYPQLRRYVESVLRALPNASLEQLAVKRESVGQAQAEVRLKWSFWLYGTTPAASVRVVTP